MIQASDFLGPAVRQGYTFWTGVPCSFLTPFINSVLNDSSLKYVGASSEGEAVGIASGAALAGQKAVMICQNSGLGNTVNPLTSLNFPFRIPVLLITTHRAEPGVADEPQHELMGQITEKMLDLMQIPWEVFPKEASQVEAVLQRAEDSMAKTGMPYALVMKKGSVADCELVPRPRTVMPKPAHEDGRLIGVFSNPPSKWAPRMDYIQAVREGVGKESGLVATTGKIGRELFTLGHRPGQLYVVGSMGCASGIGFGIHESARGKKHVTVIDGDGAALMKMGNLATIGHYRPERFLHIILDNEVHESTGAQPTVSSTVDFAMIASAAGYQRIWRTDQLEDFKKILPIAKDQKGPCLIHAKVGISTDQKLGRPTVTPVQVKDQFRDWWKTLG
ncbi:MAG: phosphonopyruvate decarboxylase [Bdellovibrionales bacterium]|nr:phosphonopyruvate decarboxylase [Bdellovibrionales bacterium]